jgi:hypothetical protein
MVTNLADAGAGSLRQAIVDTPAGGTVDFQPGLSGTITLATGELAIAKDLTVAGPGADVLTVSGNDASRVFSIAASFTVTLSGLSISRGLIPVNEYGGGVLNSGTLTIADSIIRDNTAPAEGVASGGGGIYNSGTLTINNSTLTGNSAPGSTGLGGGIHSRGMLTVNDSTLSGNSAGGNGGGGIYSGGAMVIINSTISGNTGGYDGGGIRSGGEATIVGSTISGNTSHGGSGGGGIGSGARLTISNSTISGNTAGDHGGGVDQYGSSLTITGSTISGNRGRTYGGGIGIYNAIATITNSTISGNTVDTTDLGLSSYGGGGIANHLGSLTVTNSTITGNTASGGGAPAPYSRGSGGGIYSSSHNPYVLTVMNSTITGNAAIANNGNAAFGGGVFINYDFNPAPATIMNSTLSGNTASSSAGGFGGGIYLWGDGGRLTVMSSTLSGNTASGSGGSAGGGIASQHDRTVPIRNSIVAGNTAPISPDVGTRLTSWGYNLIGVGDGGTGYDPTDLVGTLASPIDPLLEPLGDYGGPTQTLRPRPDSPAVDAGLHFNTVLADQRGFPRHVDAAADIGAVELQPTEGAGPAGFPVAGGELGAVLRLLAERTERGAWWLYDPDRDAAATRFLEPTER